MLPWRLIVKNPPANAGDMGSISGSERSPKERNGNPLQYSCLGNPMDRGAYHSWGHKRVGHDLATRQQKQKLFFTVVSFCCTTWISYMYTYIPSHIELPSHLNWTELNFHLHPPIQVITEHWAELRVLCSSFPLASSFIHGSVYMSMPLSQFIPLSPSPTPCPQVFLYICVSVPALEKSFLEEQILHKYFLTFMVSKNNVLET